jgi:putative peptidoglycan lipid II flippase
VPLIATLFYYGAFSANDVLATRNATIAYSVGLVGLILVKILAPAFYAKQDIRTPVKIAVVTLLVTQVMNLIFMQFWQHAGLALATGLGSCLNAALLYRGLHRRGVHQPQPGWGGFLLKLLIAVCAMAILLWFTAGDALMWIGLNAHGRVWRLTWVVLLGAASYFAVLWLLGFRLADFKRYEAR